MQLHKVYNLIKIRKLKRAKKFLNTIEADFDENASIDDIAYAKYLRGKIADKENKFEEAVEYYQEIVDFGKKIKKDTYLVPFSMHKLLILKIKQIEEYNYGEDVSKEDLDYIMRTVKNIEKASDYDFEKPLMRKIERIKDYFRPNYHA